MTSPISDKVVLVTGASGYFGIRLIERLLDLDASQVYALDVVNFPHEKLPKGKRARAKAKILSHVCDISSYDELVAKFIACFTLVWMIITSDLLDCAASYGMSGKEMLNTKQIELVNVQGTHNIIRLCKECNIPSIVYTSTYNVVFGGNSLPNKDESEPYFPLHKHPDHYSRTKSIAEQAILAANDEVHLTTCALRPAAIYGEGEQRHFPRIVDYMKKGLFTFTIGSSNTRVEFVHVDNLVHAHILAAEKLISARERGINTPVAGSAYFISDQHPFMRPLAENLGFSFPKIAIPTMIMYYVAWIMEILFRLANPFFNFPLLLTRSEVNKVAVTHYFNPTRSQTELGYYPILTSEEGMQRLVNYWVEKEKEYLKAQRNKSGNSFAAYILLCISVLILLISWMQS